MSRSGSNELANICKHPCLLAVPNAAQVLLQPQPVWAGGLRIQNLASHTHTCMDTHTQITQMHARKTKQVLIHERIESRKRHTALVLRCIIEIPKQKEIKNISDSAIQPFVFPPPLCSLFPWYLFTFNSHFYLTPSFFSVFSLFLTFSPCSVSFPFSAIIPTS